MAKYLINLKKTQTKSELSEQKRFLIDVRLNYSMVHYR